MWAPRVGLVPTLRVSALRHLPGWIGRANGLRKAAASALPARLCLGPGPTSCSVLAAAGFLVTWRYGNISEEGWGPGGRRSRRRVPATRFRPGGGSPLLLTVPRPRPCAWPHSPGALQGRPEARLAASPSAGKALGCVLSDATAAPLPASASLDGGAHAEVFSFSSKRKINACGRPGGR